MYTLLHTCMHAYIHTIYIHTCICTCVRADSQTDRQMRQTDAPAGRISLPYNMDGTVEGQHKHPVIPLDGACGFLRDHHSDNDEDQSIGKVRQHLPKPKHKQVYMYFLFKDINKISLSKYNDSKFTHNVVLFPWYDKSWEICITPCTLII